MYEDGPDEGDRAIELGIQEYHRKLMRDEPWKRDPVRPPMGHRLIPRPISALTMFGVLPELAAIEFGEQFEAVKQLGRESIEKQLEIIQGHELIMALYAADPLNYASSRAGSIFDLRVLPSRPGHPGRVHG